MTDCFICGHPILEGQRRSDASSILIDEDGTRVTQSNIEHANPADHLPTLDKVTEARLLAEGLLEDRVRKERERAARLVEEKANDGSLGEPSVVVLRGLANRIRGDE